MNLGSKHANSFPVSIFIAGDYDKAVISVREYCETIGYGVTVTRTKYVYTGGEEEGVIIGLINYPRFPTGPNEILNHAILLGEKLLVDLDQETFSIQNHRNTAWYSRRPADLPPVIVEPIPEPIPEVVEAPVEVVAEIKKKKTKGSKSKNKTSTTEVVEPEVVEPEVVEPEVEVRVEVVEPIVVEVKSQNARASKKAKTSKNKVSTVEVVAPPPVEETLTPVDEVVEPVAEVVEPVVEPIIEIVAPPVEVIVPPTVVAEVKSNNRWSSTLKGNKNGTKSSKRR